jgi:adenylate cyclase class 2
MGSFKKVVRIESIACRCLTREDPHRFIGMVPPWEGMTPPQGGEALEVEAKIPVLALAPVRERLQDLHAMLVTIVEERDLYYNHPARDFGSTDEALRLRYAGGEATLTYKGQKIADYSLKAREEIIVTIAPGERMEVLLSRLGFRYVRSVEKYREIYRFEHTTVSLDEVRGLGSFVEIEVLGGTDPEETIRHVQRALGIEGEHIPQSYLELLLAKNPSAPPGFPSPLR